MKRYFNDLGTLHRFTLSLDSQPHPIRCQHCSKQGQFVSHGFVYKKQHHGEKRTVGKRLFCSNRYGRSGCGRTLRLYLATELAFLHYTTVHLTAFLLALLDGRTIITLIGRPRRPPSRAMRIAGSASCNVSLSITGRCSHRAYNRLPGLR